jgi:integral membrane protein (TIGR01906 family)
MANPSNRSTRILQLLLTLAAPALLALTAVRLVTLGTWFIDFEYGRSDFPEDRYGFTQAQRREYANYAMRYIRDNLGTAYLGERTLPDGDPMFTERELSHMQDVQAVTQAAFVVHAALLVFAAAAGVYLARCPQRRPALRRAAYWGGMLTLALIVSLIVVGVLSWDLFFDTFHAIFFESGTWRFHASDTLLRLFPQQFWFDAALAVGGLTAAGALGLVVAGRRGVKWATSF